MKNRSRKFTPHEAGSSNFEKTSHVREWITSRRNSINTTNPRKARLAGASRRFALASEITARPPPPPILYLQYAPDADRFFFHPIAGSLATYSFSFPARSSPGFSSPVRERRARRANGLPRSLLPTYTTTFFSFFPASPTRATERFFSFLCFTFREGAAFLRSLIRINGDWKEKTWTFFRWRVWYFSFFLFLFGKKFI